jgi:hypothetical protein
MNSGDQLRARIGAKPFHSFTIVMRDDQRFEISNADAARLTPSGQTVYLLIKNGRRLLLDVVFIERVEIGDTGVVG